MNTDSSKRDKYYNTDNHIPNCEERKNERTSQESSNNSPITTDWVQLSKSESLEKVDSQSDRNYTQSRDSPEDLVNDNVVWGDPARKYEVAQELRNEAWPDISSNLSGRWNPSYFNNSPGKKYQQKLPVNTYCITMVSRGHKRPW